MSDEVIKLALLRRFMKIEFDTNEYIKTIEKSQSYFHTFINQNNIAAGILRLDPGEADTQTTHDSDEVYYIISGTGFLNVNGNDYSVSPGKAYFIKKNIPHKFHDNKSKLVVLYFFAGPDT